jgi:hypothetical protein
MHDELNAYAAANFIAWKSEWAPGGNLDIVVKREDPVCNSDRNVGFLPIPRFSSVVECDSRTKAAVARL